MTGNNLGRLHSTARNSSDNLILRTIITVYIWSAFLKPGVDYDERVCEIRTFGGILFLSFKAMMEWMCNDGEFRLLREYRIRITYFTCRMVYIYCQFILMIVYLLGKATVNQKAYLPADRKKLPHSLLLGPPSDIGMSAGLKSYSFHYHLIC